MASEYFNRYKKIQCFQVLKTFRFLLVSLAIEHILSQTTLRKMRKALDSIMTSPGRPIEDSYRRAIERIEAQSEARKQLAIDILS